MAELILFHHAQGLTPGVLEFADRIRAAGHSVAVPDLYDGATFATVEEGVAHAKSLGFEAILEQARSLAADLPEHLVYAGFSLGALAAHMLAQTRPGAAGALLYSHGDVPMSMFGDTWPAGVDVQLHVNAGDEFCEMDVVQEFVEEAGQTARAELFVYPGSSHLFADSSLADHEPQSAVLLMERTLEFLAGRD